MCTHAEGLSSKNPNEENLERTTQPPPPLILSLILSRSPSLITHTHTHTHTQPLHLNGRERFWGLGNRGTHTSTSHSVSEIRHPKREFTHSHTHMLRHI